MVTQTTLPRPPRVAPAMPPDDHDYHDGIYYPHSDGKPMAENSYQGEAMAYVFGALKAWFDDDDDVHLIIDMIVYYLRGDPTSSFVPDIAVLFGVSDQSRRYSWRAWLEDNILPSVIFEFASRGTWRVDDAKRDLYERLGVLEYWRQDPSGRLPVPVLYGERLVNGRYRPIPLNLDESGVLRGHSEALGLDLCVIQNQELEIPELKLYDPRNGEWLLSTTESRKALREAEAEIRREAEARRRAEAEIERLRELLAQRS